MAYQVLICDLFHSIGLDVASLIYSADLRKDQCDHNVGEVISGPYLWIIFDLAFVLHCYAGKISGWSHLWQSTASIFILLDSPDTATIDFIDVYFITFFFLIILIHVLISTHRKLYRWTCSSIDRSFISTTMLVGFLNRAFLFSTPHVYPSSVFFSL